MGENHLTYFKIQNFKRFDSFEMENIGQFNLIVGDNNVGKTSVLEGLLFEENDPKFTFDRFFITLKENGRKILTEEKYKKLSDKNPSTLWELLSKKDEIEIDFSKKGKNEINKVQYIHKRSSELTENERSIIEEKYRKPAILFKDFWIQASLNGNSLNISNNFFEEMEDNEDYKFCNSLVYFSTSQRGFSISSTYQLFVDKNRNYREEFNKAFKIIVPNLDEIRPYFSDIIEEPSIGIVLKNDPLTFPIEQFGDGVLKIFRILVSCFIAQNKRLLIDEIEAGIHFSRLKDFWKTVILLCKKYDVQLFATTHSLECQRYFVEAFSELEEEDREKARNISLIETPQGNVESVTYNFEQFELALKVGANTRGGQR